MGGKLYNAKMIKIWTVKCSSKADISYLIHLTKKKFGFSVYAWYCTCTVANVLKDQ